MIIKLFDIIKEYILMKTYILQTVAFDQLVTSQYNRDKFGFIWKLIDFKNNSL